MALDESQPFVKVEHVTRRYEPVRVRRIEHVFAVLGGIVPGEGATYEDEDEDEPLLGQEAGVERVLRPRVALDDVSFDAAGGSCIALVGPAAAGKSVLMRTIAGLSPPTSGRVVVHGRLGAALDSSVRLFPRSGKVGSGLPVFAAIHGISARLVRSRLQMIADSLAWPQMQKQYASLLTNKQRRRLMLGFALHVDADVVVIDIPMSAIVTTPLAIQQRMLELKRDGKILIVTARDVDSVSWIADRVLHMARGVIHDDDHVVPSNEPPMPRRQEPDEEEPDFEAGLVSAPGNL